jgi:hypothetical protein
MTRSQRETPEEELVRITDQFAARASRGFEILLGLVSTLLGAILLLAMAFATYNMLGHHVSLSVIAVLLATTGLGLLLLSAGLRLVTAKHRSDGGLLSPWILRFGGVFFLFAPFALLITQLSWSVVFEAGVLLSAGIACFALANRRSQLGSGADGPNNRWRGP